MQVAAVGLERGLRKESLGKLVILEKKEEEEEKEEKEEKEEEGEAPCQTIVSLFIRISIARMAGYLALSHTHNTNNSLQHTAIHLNTLQLTTNHCNSL